MDLIGKQRKGPYKTCQTRWRLTDALSYGAALGEVVLLE